MSKAKKMGTLFSHSPPVGSYKSSNELVLSRARIGVEIEVDRVKGGVQALYNTVMNDTRPASGLWRVVEDGSVHNNGAEMVFDRPLFGQDVMDALEYFYILQKELDFKCGLETGIHVHLDVRNMEYEEFSRLCILYALVEPILFNWIGNEREFNIFCEPWYRAQGDLSRISAVLYGSDSRKRAEAQELQRYTSLNLAALTTFGSIEFRHLPTSFDKKVLLDWINIILSLKRAASTVKEEDYDILLKLSSEGPEALFRQLFPFKGLASKLLKGEYPRLLDIGCLTVQDIIIANKGSQKNRMRTYTEWAVDDWTAKGGGSKTKTVKKAHPGYIKVAAARKRKLAKARGKTSPKKLRRA